MKYPQLVSMPSALQDWLDEQLEARGIDAVVYTRYILSLLQRDTLDPPDDLLSLSPNKFKEVGRRGRKRGRSREEYWHMWDCEQLKRSAAVECLKSASDQKCGIEKLVDELCAKLKEIQSEGESSVQLELSETSVPNKHSSTRSSPQDQAQKYYAAFPPLNSKFAESSKSLITLIPEAGVWNGKKILADSFGKNKSCSEALKEHKNWAEENKENDGNSNSWKEIGRETIKSRSQMKDDALNLSKQKKEDCYGFAWNMAEERNNTCNDFVVGYGEDSVFVSNKQNIDAGCRRLYERQMDEPVDHMEEEEADGNTDDLAQLIAKFDHSIEALWNPDDPSGSSDNISSDGTLECEQELPLDFQHLLSSPSEQFLTVELYNKRNASVFSSRNSFIQCGTNITSSIWSDQPSLENSAEQEDNGMDYSYAEQASVDTGLKNVLTGEEKTVGSKLYNREDVSTRNKENCNNEKNSATKSDLEWIGNDVSSYFTNDNTLNLVPETNTTQKWSDESPVANYCQDDGIGQVDEHKVGIYNSLNTLNHNREGSSFTEVIPKHSSHIRSRAKPNEDNVKRTRDDPNEMADVEKEEEDLLTSTRTHFRPIRNDSLDSQNGSNTVGCYADGTTFVIPTSLDEVAFRRSESGALYLEADAGPETPKKYMEYKEKEIWHCYSSVNDSTREFIPKFRVRQNEKCCQTEETEEQSASDEEVDVKRSRHDTKAVSESEDFFFPDDKQFADKMEDKSEVSTNNNSVCTSCHLLHKQQCNFTGLGNQCNVGAGAECSYGNVMQQTKHFCIKCDEHLMPHSCKFGWLKSPSSTAENVWQSTAANDKEDHLLDSWYTIWKSDPGEVSGGICTSCGEVQLMTDSKSLQYSRLREELTKDGEQLLSDLSYMQHLYQGSDWQDDSVPGGDIECKSSQEELLYGEDSSAAGKELQTKQAFESSSPLNNLKKEMWLSTDLESEWTQNERPFTVKSLQKDRKRKR